MKLIFRKAFTLMEVNIAIFIMSVGVLSMVSLYSLGYREQSQGKEDVHAAATAELYLAPLVASLSDPNLPWSTFNAIKSFPETAWEGYVESDDRVTNIGENSKNKQTKAPKVKRDASNLANSAFSHANKGTGKFNFSVPDSNLEVILVVQHKPNSPIVRLSLRSGNRLGALMSQPLYYTEVHFQGDPNK